MGISGLVMKPIVMREMAKVIKRVSDGEVSSEKNAPERTNDPAAEQRGIFKGNETPQGGGNYPSSAAGGLEVA